MRLDPGLAAGVPESRLTDALRRLLPPDPPAPPWRVRAHLTTWWHRAPADAVDLLPAPLRRRPTTSVTVWMLVDYLDTPVGRYHELLVSPVLLRHPTAVHVPFIAVSTAASVAAGRAGWALPKVLADFEVTGRRTTVRPLEPADPAWSLRVEVGRGGPPLPVVSRGGGDQVHDDRVLRYRTDVVGASRLTRATVEAAGAGPLGRLLRPGRHWGFRSRVRLTVTAPSDVGQPLASRSSSVTNGR